LNRDRSTLLLRAKDEKITTRVCDFIDGEYACHGIAASTLLSPANKESRIHAESAHMKLPRPPIKDMLGPHSSYVFSDAVTEVMYRDIYGRLFIAVWWHDFDLLYIDVNDERTLTRDLCYGFEVFWASAIDETVYHNVGRIEFGSKGLHGAAFARGSYAGMPSLKTTAKAALTARIIYLLVRVSGCDFGLWGTFTLAKMKNHYQWKGWWFNLTILTSQSSSPTSWNEQIKIILNLYFKGMALIASNMSCEAAEFFGQMLLIAPPIQRTSLLHRQALALFHHEDFVKSEAAFVGALRECFLQLGDQGAPVGKSVFSHDIVLRLRKISHVCTSPDTELLGARRAMTCRFYSWAASAALLSRRNL
jgi:hypothetical protein